MFTFFLGFYSMCIYNLLKNILKDYNPQTKTGDNTLTNRVFSGGWIVKYCYSFLLSPIFIMHTLFRGIPTGALKIL